MARSVRILWVVLSAACASPEQLTPVARGLSVEEAVDFGSLYAGASATRVLALQATHPGTVRVLALTTSASAVAIDPAGPFTVVGLSTQEVSVTWRPADPEALDGVLTVATSIGDFEVALRGVALPHLTCDDHNPCTEDAFDPTRGVCVTSIVTNGTPCDDGSLCTTSDVCADGVCVGQAVSCDDGKDCTADGCDPKVGCQHVLDPSMCEDPGPCAVSACAEDGTCTTTPLPDGTACGALSCAGLPLCQAGECELLSVDGMACDDGNVCTVDDVCANGRCVGEVDETAAECPAEVWFGLGGSDFALWSEFTEWGSASGGGVSQTAAASNTPSLAVDPSGHPVVAWEDNGEIYVKRWTGGAWEEVGSGSASGGGISNTAGESGQPSLALNGLGHPVVAWRDYSSNTSQIYIRRWTGSVWEEVGSGSASGGGISQTSGTASGPSLALDALGQPVVAWSDSSNGLNQIYIKRWTGSVWEEVGSGSASGGGISNVAGQAQDPSLSLDASGHPVVAWQQWTGQDTCIYLKRWTGVEWEEVSGSASGDGIATGSSSVHHPSLSLDSSDYPVVAWYGGRDIYMKRWTGTAWEEVGSNWASGAGVGISNTTDSSIDPSLALDGAGHPVVAWQDQQSIFVRRWTGSVWEEVGIGSASGGGISNSLGLSRKPSLALDAWGRVVVAWSDDASGNFEIYLRRWAGSDWEEVGSGQASGGGISDTPDHSRYPSLSSNALGHVGLAWTDDSNGSAEIYVRRWTGSAWEEVGSGSASGGGISHTASNSLYPSMVLDSSGDPVVAWSEGGRLYVKRWTTSAWEELGTGGLGDIVWNSSPSLLLDPVGHPVVAWSAPSNGIYVKRWSGSAWEGLGGGSDDQGAIGNPGGYSLYPSLALDASGHPMVAWQGAATNRYVIYAKRWTGSAWEEVGSGSASGDGISGTQGSSRAPSLAFDSTGAPVLAWQELAGADYQIYVKRWSGDAWEELGSGSASGGGVSNTPGRAFAPRLFMDATGHPVVAWQDDSSGPHEIYVKRFDGTTWTELEGSASGGGVSRSGASSTSPALTVDGNNRVCVAWQEYGHKSEQVLLRCAHWP